MVADRPKRVVCQTCGSQHNYRAPKSASSGIRARKVTKTPSKSPTARARAESERQQEWERRIAGNALDSFKRYTISQVFKPDDLVSHKKFGEGYVVEILDAYKVTIMFKDGLRTLAQAQT